VSSLVNWYKLFSVLNMISMLIWGNPGQNVRITDESFGFAPSTLVFKGSDTALGKSKY
jgi:hypothetical protein